MTDTAICTQRHQTILVYNLFYTTGYLIRVRLGILGTCILRRNLKFKASISTCRAPLGHIIMDAHRLLLSNGCVRRLLLDRSTTEQGCILQIVSIQVTDSKIIVSLTDGVELIDGIIFHTCLIYLFHLPFSVSI